jgi:lysophospholipase L1-like esterase
VSQAADFASGGFKWDTRLLVEPVLEWTPGGRTIESRIAAAFGVLLVVSACGGGGGGGSSETGTSTHALKLQDINQDGQILLMGFGDSITAGVGDGPSETDWPQPGGYPLRLQNDLGLTVFNEGNPGERTSDGEPRLREVLPTKNPDYVILLEGTNDVEDGHEAQALTNIQTMLDDIFASGAQPLLGTITPSCCNHQNMLPQGAIFDYNDHLRSIAANESIPLVDFYAALAGGPQTPYPVDGSPGFIHVPEGLHPTPDGYDLMSTTAGAWFHH